MRDWDDTYRQGDTPWDSGEKCSELFRVLDEDNIMPGRALDLGCGTGTNAIYLARMGFDVTGVDISTVAIERAQGKAKEADLSVLFMTERLPSDFLHGNIFDFIFDRGCFHTIDNDDRPGYLEMLKNITKEGSVYLMLCGNAREPRSPGPPVLTEEEIRETFSGLFHIVRIRDFRFDTEGGKEAPLGHSCLMKRKGRKEEVS